MRNSTTDQTGEMRLLSAITLTCYLTTLAGLLVMGYTVFSLAARTLDEHIFAAYTRQVF